VTALIPIAVVRPEHVSIITTPATTNLAVSGEANRIIAAAINVNPEMVLALLGRVT